MHRKKANSRQAHGARPEREEEANYGGGAAAAASKGSKREHAATLFTRDPKRGGYRPADQIAMKGIKNT